MVVFPTHNTFQKAIAKINVGYGYEHSPSALLEKNGVVYLGTRNGVVYAIDVANKTTIWAYKIDNSMVNTLNIIDDRNIIAATMDGKIVLLQAK